MERFVEGVMAQKFKCGSSYISPEREPEFGRLFPSLAFYSHTILGPAQWVCRRAAGNACDDNAWVHSSVWLADVFERMGGKMILEGLDNLDQDGPFLVIANHMSTFETLLLPGIIRPHRPVTFVVKQSLVTVPFFGPVMRSRDPIVVGRSNPRQDLTTVFEGGQERLGKGIAIVIFPQHTRSMTFDPQQFNTIGIKLAKKAGVPIVPLALKTDAWGQGKKIKELGKIRPDLPVHFRFGKAMTVNGPGKDEHAAICEFIGNSLRQWEDEEGVNRD